MVENSTNNRRGYAMFFNMFKEIWRASNQFYKNEKQHLIFLSILVGLASLVSAILPYFIKLIIDQTNKNQSIGYIYILVISYCFAWLLSQILEWVKNALGGLITAKQETSILITGLSNYLRIQKKQQDKIDTGVFNAEAIRASKAFSMIIFAVLLVFVPVILQLFFISYILYLNIGLIFSLGFISAAILLFLISNLINRKSKTYYEPLYSIGNILQGRFLEKINHAYEIKVNNAVDFEVAQFEKSVKRFVDQSFYSHSRIAALMVLQIAFIFLFLLVFLLLSTKLFSLGTITTGDMVMISSYIMMLTTPSLMISQQINLLAGNMVAIEKFYQYLKLEKDQLSDHTFTEEDIAFLFNDAVLEVGGKKTVPFSLKFYKHKMYAVVGKTGTGKSTLINYILGAYRLHAGQLFYKNLDITYAYSNKIFEEVAFVGQSSTISTGSLRENLIYNSQHDYPDQELLSLIDYFELGNILADHHLSLDSEIDEYIKSFSGGEKQRLNILRAFLKQPKVMILDEPTSALDPKTAIKILKFLRDNIETLIVITHFKGCIELADEIIDIEKILNFSES
ncbi:ATP-binding cassette domain-containing protein [Acinetobacter junii]|uniref:ATP-binding cassette domain-containing protein n=1 Tax=Acinetobacter junii TaxID=40215 RepID=UPI003AF72A47